jgi:hypothetical protein
MGSVGVPAVIRRGRSYKHDLLWETYDWRSNEMPDFFMDELTRIGRRSLEKAGQLLSEHEKSVGRLELVGYEKLTDDGLALPVFGRSRFRHPSAFSLPYRVAQPPKSFVGKLKRPQHILDSFGES